MAVPFVVDVKVDARDLVPALRPPALSEASFDNVSGLAEASSMSASLRSTLLVVVSLPFAVETE